MNSDVSNWQLACPVRRLAVNLQGRDFVVGDLHGSLTQLEDALLALEFDPKQDRLLSVGDLVDRGPSSQMLIEWLDLPWFYACVGNHEAVLLDYVTTEDNDLAKRWCRFGGNWFFGLNRKEQLSIAEKIKQRCSFAIEVVTADEQVLLGVVHADVPGEMSWQTFCAEISHNPDVQYDALWSRARGRGEINHPIEGVEQVVCGHEIVSAAHQQGNVWMLDTGAYRSNKGIGKLSMLELPNRLHTFN